MMLESYLPICNDVHMISGYATETVRCCFLLDSTPKNVPHHPHCLPLETRKLGFDDCRNGCPHKFTVNVCIQVSHTVALSAQTLGNAAWCKHIRPSNDQFLGYTLLLPLGRGRRNEGISGGRIGKSKQDVVRRRLGDRMLRIAECLPAIQCKFTAKNNSTVFIHGIQLELSISTAALFRSLP
jgi:hypothetical protein